MTDSATSIEAIMPAPDAIATQSAQATLAASNKANATNQAAFLTEIAQAELANEALTLDSSLGINPASTQNNVSANDGLLNLETPTLSLFNEFSTNLGSANITRNLTTQQMQEIGILLKDEQGLEAAANLNIPLPLADNTTTVDLSLAAQAIANGTRTTASVNALAFLTPAQLGQIGAILTPLANTPLTQSLFLQIQAQWTAAGLSPLQFSLNTIVLIMNYMAGLQPAPINAIQTNKTASIHREVEVDSVISADEVTVEDNAVLL